MKNKDKHKRTKRILPVLAAMAAVSAIIWCGIIGMELVDSRMASSLPASRQTLFAFAAHGDSINITVFGTEAQLDTASLSAALHDTAEAVRAGFEALLEGISKCAGELRSFARRLPAKFV